MGTSLRRRLLTVFGLVGFVAGVSLVMFTFPVRRHGGSPLNYFWGYPSLEAHITAIVVGAIIAVTSASIGVRYGFLEKFIVDRDSETGQFQDPNLLGRFLWYVQPADERQPIIESDSKNTEENETAGSSESERGTE